MNRLAQSQKARTTVRHTLRRRGYCGYSSFLEGSDHQGEGLLRGVTQHQVQPGVDVDPDVHLTVLVQDPHLLSYSMFPAAAVQ